MSLISWLHFTDFHQGMGSQDWLWPNVREQFFEDLKVLHDRTGPWDLVLFTGDLTQRGTQNDFQSLSATLEEVWETFRSLGSRPQLLLVPGNHDLCRPDAKDPTVKALNKLWATDPEIQEDFWKDEQSPYRKLVAQTFAPFTDWWRTSKFNTATDLRLGLIPGDFSATVTKNGLALGIVGLNTAFLQLTAGDYKGKLALSPRQFHAACESDGAKWIKRHHACILMTHHPASWLDEPSKKDLRAEIDVPGRFAIHLCGHLHDSQMLSVSEGGAVPRRTLQGTSLFGLEQWFDNQGRGLDRSHGYSAGRLVADGPDARLMIWPRRLQQNKSAGHWRMVPDRENFDLATDDAATLSFQPLQPLTSGGAPNEATSASKEPQRISVDPGTLIRDKTRAILADRKVAADNVEEIVISNLLRVKEYPQTIWGIPSTLKSKADPHGPTRLLPCILREKMLYSFYDPASPSYPFAGLRDDGRSQKISTATWLASFERRSWFIELLKVTLKEHLWEKFVGLDPASKRYYFRRRAPGRSVKIRWIGNAQRTVVRKPDEGKGGYWVHQAARLQFEFLDDELYLAIEPSYTFTVDGRKPIPREEIGPLTIQWRGRERNGAVLRHVLMWCNLLTSGPTNGAIPCGAQRLWFSRVPAHAHVPIGLETDHIEVRALLELTRIESELIVPDEESFIFLEDDHDANHEAKTEDEDDSR